MGFFVPPMLVPDVQDIALIGVRLRILYYVLAIICVICFILMTIGNREPFLIYCTRSFHCSFSTCTSNFTIPSTRKSFTSNRTTLWTNVKTSSHKPMVSHFTFLLRFDEHYFPVSFINLLLSRSEYRGLLFNFDCLKSCVYVLFWSMLEWCETMLIIESVIAN